MFEKEAEERITEQFGTSGEYVTRQRIWQDGAEFGYNKANNEWHDLRKDPNDLPTIDDKLYLVYVYSNSPTKFRFGEYTPVVCLWNYDFCRFDILEFTIGATAVNTKNILKWREIESC